MMTDAISVADLQKKQGELQETFEKSQKSLQDAKAGYDKAKAELVAFNNKFGRVLQMMREDE